MVKLTLLKKIGFHIYKGAIPHFNRIVNKIINQVTPTSSISLKPETIIKK
jgi:hypothetical protein